MLVFFFFFISLDWLDVGSFPARLECTGIKATLKINPLWLIYFLSCRVKFEIKRSKCVFKSSKVRSRHLFLIQKSEQMYSLGRSRGASAGLSAVCCTSLRCSVSPIQTVTHTSWTITAKVWCKELEMAIGVSGPRSHYSLNTLRIMKLGQGRAEMENCAVEVQWAIAHFCLNP